MIKVEDIVYVRFSAPDLDAMQRFAEDFGLLPTERSEDRLYCRGTDTTPFVHVTERGEAGFLGVGFRAASEADLTAVAKSPDASDVEPVDEPGGGHRVRLTDPNGHRIDVVHGATPLPPLDVRQALPLNRGSERVRLGTLQRVPRGPAQVKRLGHFVIRVADYAKSQAWYQNHFGFLESDRIYLGDEGNIVSAFLRCDRGDTFVDHHTMLCVGLGEPGFDHAAFEVEDFDAVMAGHDHLSQAGYDHHAGIGRHILGSQVFDYWKDPWGHVVEHFTDGDLLDASAKPADTDPATALGTQWGRFG